MAAVYSFDLSAFEVISNVYRLFLSCLFGFEESLLTSLQPHRLKPRRTALYHRRFIHRAVAQHTSIHDVVFRPLSNRQGYDGQPALGVREKGRAPF